MCIYIYSVWQQVGENTRNDFYEDTVRRKSRIKTAINNTLVFNYKCVNIYINST